MHYTRIRVSFSMIFRYQTIVNSSSNKCDSMPFSRVCNFIPFFPATQFHCQRHFCTRNSTILRSIAASVHPFSHFTTTTTSTHLARFFASTYSDIYTHLPSQVLCIHSDIHTHSPCQVLCIHSDNIYTRSPSQESETLYLSQKLQFLYVKHQILCSARLGVEPSTFSYVYQ